MTRGDSYPKPEHYGDASIPAFGYELLRNELLPELLGNECASILYWSGRKMARNHPLDSEDQIPAFFRQAGWGELEQTEQKKNKLTFECTSPIIESRIKDHPETAVFTIEAGFLAEQYQRLLGRTAESYAEIKTGHNKKVLFVVKWDEKDRI